jgi:hypothetical protein
VTTTRVVAWMKNTQSWLFVYVAGPSENVPDDTALDCAPVHGPVTDTVAVPCRAADPVGHVRGVQPVVVKTSEHVLQVDEPVAVFVENEGHPKQPAVPTMLLYVPTSHATHGWPLGPVYPALQALTTHATIDVLAVDESEPMGQVEHAVLPVVFLYFPATHAVQVPPFAPVKPVLQAQSVSAVLALGEVELPGHAEHDALPVKLLYVPVTHAVHVPPFDPLKPALHVQAVIAVLVLGEFELVGQFKHAALPVTSLYFPVTHAVHVVPSGPLKPMLHLQSVFVDFAIYEFEFTGQFKQVIALEYVAPVQSTHAVLPVLPLYLPAEHNAQEPPFRPV